jgi:hypothetical protein
VISAVCEASTFQESGKVAGDNLLMTTAFFLLILVFPSNQIDKAQSHIDISFYPLIFNVVIKQFIYLFVIACIKVA